MEEPDMKYEYIIRGCHHTTRYGVPGADADVYRHLQGKYVTERDNKDPEKSRILLWDYAFACGEVSAFLYTAIKAFQREHDDTLKEHEREAIDDIYHLLQNATVDEIDEAIEKFTPIMNGRGVFL